MSVQHDNMNNTLMMFGAMFGVTVRNSGVPGEKATSWDVLPTDRVCVSVLEKCAQTWDVQFFVENMLVNEYKGFHDYINVMRTVAALAIASLPIEIG